MYLQGYSKRLYSVMFVAGIWMFKTSTFQPAVAAGAYKVINTTKVGGEGGFDYVFADSDGRRLYVPRSGGATGRVTVFDLDTLKSIGEIANTNSVHGVAIDPKSKHGFSSSKPVVMFDTNR